LFGSFIDCSKNQGSSGKGTKSTSQSAIKTTVTKVKTNPIELAYLQQQWKKWKHDLKTFHLKLEFQIANSLSKKEGVQQNSSVVALNSVDKMTLRSATTHLSTPEHNIDDLVRFYVNTNNPVLIYFIY
jgi:hypothetical protein